MKTIKCAAVPAMFGFFLPCAFGQAPPPPVPADKEKTPAAAVAAINPCPTIQVQAPSSKILRDGQPVTFGVNIAGGDPNVVPTLVWNTTAGTIVAGQGTRSIQVDSTGAGVNREIVADLWIGGLAPECVSQASGMVRVAGPPVKVDEFGELPVEKENERLAAFVTSLPHANDQVVVIAYAGRNNVRGFAGNGLRRIRTQLGIAGAPLDRVSITDGGFREEPAYELWLVPEGSEPPRATPTVDRKEIVYPQTVPARRPPAKRP
jgi:hypothetical protein